MTNGFKFPIQISRKQIIDYSESSCPTQVMTDKSWAIDTTYGKFPKIGIGAAIDTSGRLWTWGRAALGSLGNNDTAINQSSPVQTVAGGTNWCVVSSTGNAVTAVKTDGTLWNWGINTSGYLGDNSAISKSSPVQTVGNATNWCAAGVRIGLKTDGTLWVWGAGSCGMLGNLATINHSSPIQTVAGGTNWCIVPIFTGQRLTNAAIKSDGTLWLWGYGGQGVLGNNVRINHSSPIQTISGGTNWLQPAIVSTTAGGVKADGTLWMWGNDGNCGSYLGTNSGVSVSSPVQTASGGTNWKSLQVNLGAFAFKTDNTLWGWGRRVSGTSGNLSEYRIQCPVQINSETCWRNAVGTQGTVHLVTSSNQLFSWGSNNFGILGSGKSGFVNVDYTSCVRADVNDVFVRKDLFTDSGLWAWGLGAGGSLGNNDTTPRSSPIQTISGGSNWKKLGAGYLHNTAIKTDGTLWSWGTNTDGQLGTNSAVNQSSPVQTISGGTNWKDISAGFCHTASIKTDGTLWMWGAGTSGKLGNNGTVSQSSPVQTVSGGSNWKKISIAQSSIAIKTDGSLWLWGNGGLGQNGNDTTVSPSSPIQTVAGGCNWKEADSGQSQNGAIKTDGTLWMWGNGGGGRLGTNDLISRSSPVQTVAGGTNWRSLSLGYIHTVAIKTDGTLWSWGNGGAGRMGDNTIANKSSPVQTITGGNNWKCAVASMPTIAIKTDGTLWAWGHNTEGEVGNNSTVNVASPVQTAAGGDTWKDASASGCNILAVREDCW